MGLFLKRRRDVLAKQWITLKTVEFDVNKRKKLME